MLFRLESILRCLLHPPGDSGNHGACLLGRRTLNQHPPQYGEFRLSVPFVKIILSTENAQPVKVSLVELFLQMNLIGTFIFMTFFFCYIFAPEWGGITKAWSSSDVTGTLTRR